MFSKIWFSEGERTLICLKSKVAVSTWLISIFTIRCIWKTTAEQNNLSCNRQAALALPFITATYGGPYSLLTDRTEDNSVTKTVVIFMRLRRGIIREHDRPWALEPFHRHSHNTVIAHSVPVLLVPKSCSLGSVTLPTISKNSCVIKLQFWSQGKLVWGSYWCFWVLYSFLLFIPSLLM